MEVNVFNMFYSSSILENRCKHVVVIHHPSLEAYVLGYAQYHTWILESEDEELSINIDVNYGKTNNKRTLYHKNLDNHIQFVSSDTFNIPQPVPYGETGRKLVINGAKKNWQLRITKVENTEAYSNLNGTGKKECKTNPGNIEIGDDNQW